MALRDQCSCSSYAALSLHSIPAPIIPEVARSKVSFRAALSDENNENNNNKNDKIYVLAVRLAILCLWRQEILPT